MKKEEVKPIINELKNLLGSDEIETIIFGAEYLKPEIAKTLGLDIKEKYKKLNVLDEIYKKTIFHSKE